MARRPRPPATAETRRKISEAQTGHPVSEETRRKISEAARARRGRPVSPETRRKISDANKGRPKSPETRARIAEGARLRHSRAKGLIAEQVSENCQPRPGQMDTRTFWIAYPEHVAAYGHASDRISRAAGTGKTRKAALAAAAERR